MVEHPGNETVPDEQPPQPTYLLTPRRLVMFGAVCAVLGGVMLSQLGGGHSAPAAPSSAVAAPAPAAPEVTAGPPSSTTPTSSAASSTDRPTIPPVATVPAGRPGTPRGVPATTSPLNLADPTAVGEAFTVATFSCDTDLDVSPADAQRRSMQFTSPPYAAQLQTSGTQPGGARWTTLAEHRGYTTPALVENRDGGRPPDTATTAVRSWMVTITGHSVDSWSAPMGTALVFVSMTRADPAGPWQVSGVQIPSAT